MKVINSIILLLSFYFVGSALAQEPRVYPGAVVDREMNDRWGQAMREMEQGVAEAKKSLSAQAYTAGLDSLNLTKTQTASYYYTTDEFERVVQYYQGIAKEDTSAADNRTIDLSSGESEIKETAFTFDDASSISQSKSYVRISYPRFDVAPTQKKLSGGKGSEQMVKDLMEPPKQAPAKPKRTSIIIVQQR